MARKKKAGADTVLEIRTRAGGETGTAVDEDDELAALDELEGGDLARALGEKLTVEGVRVELVRFVDGNKPEFCQLYPVSVFSKEQVAADWGAGKYRVRFKDGDNKFIKGGFNFAVAARPTGAAAPAGAPSGVQDVLAVLKAQDEKSADRWFKWATLLATTVGPKLVEAWFGRQSSSKEVLDMMLAIRELTGKEAGPSTADRLEEFKNVLGLVRELKDDAAPPTTGTTGWDLAREALGAAKPVLERLAGGVALPGMAPAALPPPAPVLQNVPRGTPPAPPAPSGEDVNLRMLGWLKGTLESLLLQAARDRNPELYAEVTLDQLPDFLPAASLQEFIARADWWAVLCGFDERVRPYEGWFTHYRESLLGLLREEHAPAPAASAAPADPEPTEFN